MCCAIENYFSCQQIFLPQNGRKSRLSGTKRRSLASYVSCPKGGVRLDRGLSGYQFTSDKRKTVGRKQVHCQKIERLDFGHKGSTMRDLTSWPERGTQLSPRNGKRLLKTRRLTYIFFSFRQTTYYARHTEVSRRYSLHAPAIR